MKTDSTLNTVILILLFCPTIAVAQEGSADPAQAQKIQQAMALAVPGEEHELLGSLAGTWNQRGTLWMQPGAEPMRFEGEAANTMILGGRFLHSTSHSGEGEMHTEALWITGFDRRHHVFTNVGFDTWGTYFVTAKGSYDESTGTVTMYGEDEDPILETTQKYNTILRFVDENTYVVEIVFFDMFPGVKEFKMLEIVHTRE